MRKELMLRGLRRILLPHPGPATPSSAAMRERAMFQAPRGAVKERSRSLVEFLSQVSLFENLGPRDLARVARVVHERDYDDGEYICEEGQPAAALFMVRRGVVEVVRRRGVPEEVPLVLLEPPASFEEAAAIATGVIRWATVRARGPAALLALGKTDLDALILDSPALANKVLTRLAGIIAVRFQMLADAEILRESEEREDASHGPRR